MSAVSSPPPAAPSSFEPRVRRTSRKRRVTVATARMRHTARREHAIVFAVAFIAYLAIGLRLVVGEHLVIFDAMARLAHAYFVFHNDPPKLSAIGFVWAPLSTLVFFPSVLIKPIATSLVALPLTTAACGAGTVTLIGAAFRHFGMSRRLRLPLVVLIAANPMLVYYSANGMSEMPYLFLLTAATYFFIRWYLNGAESLLILTATCMALATLTRYEMFAYVIAFAVAIVVIMWRRRQPQSVIEGTLIAYGAPIVYGIGLWVFFNALIVDDPLFWLRNQVAGASGAQQLGTAVVHHDYSVGQILSQLVRLNLGVNAVVIAAAVWLLAILILRRDRMAFALLLLLSVNAVTTGILLLQAGEPGYFQLRYNMRALPIGLIAIGWVFYIASARIRLAMWGSMVALLVVSIPITLKTMDSYAYQYTEQAFVQAVRSGFTKDFEGVRVTGGYVLGDADERQMADYVLAHVRRRNAILTDDAQTLGVMLLSGRPDLFFDRIDRSDRIWKQVLARPRGRVPYMLVQNVPKPPQGSDEIKLRWVGIERGAYPWARKVFANRTYILLAIVPPSLQGPRVR